MFTVTLNLAMENNAIHLQLSAPAQSLAGFEHRAATGAERAHLADIKQQISLANNIIRFHGTSCLLKDVEINISAIEPSEKAALPRQPQPAPAEHAEIIAGYRFHCQSSEELTSVSLELFRPFAALEKIHAVRLRSSQQGSALLTPSNKTINLR
ncbi:DUF2796 domain-containing protein [Thalassomonas sp. RHCl1]|uniref:ZrgA family zinc uptake protein n=1 Tax=Thalassomonas sp. RHCl1 TaxID=2995320 RepID=UPI00248BE62C|nr:DUF2796 domain-containing protein [Thalassomonas sp. RHCl1]